MPATDVDQSALRRPSSDQPGNEMDELLRCFICFDRVNDAHLCPACSSMCCRDCIVKWITERKSQCPHCQVELRVEHLVNCRFVQDLTKAVDRLQSTICHSRELCFVHHNELLYHCTNCSQCICADCAMFSSAHSGHTFEKLRVVHERHARIVSAEIATLESRLATLRQVEASIDANIATVTAAKDDAIYTLQTLAQSMEKSIMQQLKDKLIILESQRNEVSKELSLLESVVHELGCYLDPSICPKSDLIRKSGQLALMSKAINEKPLSRLASREPVSDAFHSELIPAFSESSFTIRDFMEAVSLEEVVYSSTLFRNGYNWRLKVYPNGNGGARGTYISVFLELISGLPGPEQIEYAVQMVNHRDASKAITRRFCSKFEVGESWGYNRFFLIDVLVRDGYLSEDGCLFLKFFVRPPSMHLANLEQQKYIFALEQVQGRYEQTIRDLKKCASLRDASFDSVIYTDKDDILQLDDDQAVQDDESDLDSGTREFSDSHAEQQSETEYSETSAGNLNGEAFAEQEDLGDECIGEDEGVGICELEYDVSHSHSHQEERLNAVPAPSSWNVEDDEFENIPELDNIQRLDINSNVR